MKAICDICGKAVPGNMKGQPYKHACVARVDNSVLSATADRDRRISELEAEVERLRAERNSERQRAEANGAEFRKAQAEVREAKAVSGVCVNAFKSFQMLMEGKIAENTFNSVIKSAEKDLGRAADWLKEYVDALTVEVTALREDRERCLLEFKTIQGYFTNLENGLPSSDPLTALRKMVHAKFHSAINRGIDAARAKERGGV